MLTARIHIDLNRQFGGSSPTLGSSALGYKPGLEVQRLHLEFKFPNYCGGELEGDYSGARMVIWMVYLTRPL